MPPRKARIKDIARLEVVSIGTVDRVLNDRGEVEEEKLEKIQKILKDTKIGYLPVDIVTSENVEFYLT